MIDYQPLADSELEYLRKSDQRILRRAAGEIRVRRAAEQGKLAAVVVAGLFLIATVALVGTRDREPDAAALPFSLCAHADGQLRLARTFLQRGRPGDVEDALMVVTAIAPTAAECRRDVAVFHALERAVRLGDRRRALDIVNASLRADP